MEIWKDIPGYEGLYQVSDLGRVKSLFRYKKVLKACKNKNGYIEYNLYKDKKVRSYTGHRLVASSFLGLELKFNGNNLVCHKNDIRDDNILDNLFLGTYSDNTIDCVNKGRSVDNSGEKNGMNKYSEDKIKQVKFLIKEGFKNITIEEITGVYNRTVSDIRHGKRWKHI